MALITIKGLVKRITAYQEDKQAGLMLVTDNGHKVDSNGVSSPVSTEFWVVVKTTADHWKQYDGVSIATQTVCISGLFSVNEKGLLLITTKPENIHLY